MKKIVALLLAVSLVGCYAPHKKDAPETKAPEVTTGGDGHADTSWLTWFLLWQATRPQPSPAPYHSYTRPYTSTPNYKYTTPKSHFYTRPSTRSYGSSRSFSGGGYGRGR